MNVMNKKLSPLKTPDTSPIQGKIIEEVTQIYFQKNQSYIWKRLRHQWAEKVIKYCSSKKIKSKDQIEDFIYKYLRQLMGWFEKGNNSVVGQKKLIEKNQEIVVLKNKIKEQIKIQKQKEDKIMRRNLRIKKLQKTMQDFYQKLSAGQTINITEKRKVLQLRKNLRKQRNQNKSNQQMVQIMQRAILDFINCQKLKNNKLIKQISQELTQQIKRTERQVQNYKQLCSSLIRNFEQRNKDYMKIKTQMREMKQKYKKSIENQWRIKEQTKILIEKLKKLQQNYSILEQQYVKKEQQCQFHKDQCLIMTQKHKLSLGQKQFHKDQQTNPNTSSSITLNTFNHYDFPPIQCINKNRNVQLLCQYIDACVGDQQVSLAFRFQNHHVINYTFCHQDKQSKYIDSAIQTQLLQMSDLKQQRQYLKSDNESCSSSQSEYIYQYDIGTQCVYVQTQSYSIQTQQVKLKDQIVQVGIISQHQDTYSQTQFLINCEISNLSVIVQKYKTDNQNLKQNIRNLNEELEMRKSSQQIIQRQLKQLKIQYHGTKTQLSQVKCRLINYLQDENKGERIKSKDQYEIKIKEQQKRLYQLKKENGQLKKYNGQLLQTIQYANSLFSGTCVNQNSNLTIQQKSYIKSVSKHQNFIGSNYNMNYTQTTGSQNHQYSQKSQQEAIITSRYDYENDQQTESQQKKISRQLQSYGGAVARLLSQFINSQNKQETKMNALLTLVQMLKPKGQLEEKFQRFIKLRKMMSGLGNNEIQNQRRLKTGQEDIKNRLYRFLTSN